MAQLRSIATVGGLTAVSRVLGFVRDILIAGALGAGPVADAFFVAFRLPNLFRRLFGEGAFNAAFVPLFGRRLEQEDETAARGFAEEAFSVLLFGLLIFSALAMIAMPWLMYLLAPGFSAEPEKFDLAVELSRITFPYLLFMALTALLSGVLNSLYRFAAAAAAPILLNVFFIAALVGVMPYFEWEGHVLAWTVTASGVAQFVLLWIAAARAGMPMRLVRPRLTPGVRRLGQLMGPGLVSAGAMQINIMVGTIIASLQASAVSYLYYADRIYQLPLGLIGIAIGVVLLPELTRKLRSGAEAAAHSSQNRALEFALLLTLPAAVALFVIPGPIIIALFERGAFDREASEATAAALAAFALGLPAYVLVKVLQPAFYAREDTMRPLKMALVTVAANIVLALLLFWPLRHVGLALATSIAAWLNAILLALSLRSRRDLVLDERFRTRLPRILLASAGMGLLLWLAEIPLAAWLDRGQALQLAALALLVAGGMAAYAGLALALKASSLSELRQRLKRPARPDPETTPLT